MAKSFPNIEKHPHYAYYVGYAEGAIYHIDHGALQTGWIAWYTGTDRPVNTPLTFKGKTLKEISDLLVRIGAARNEYANRALNSSK